MTLDRRRQFGLIDAMLVVALVAIALALWPNQMDLWNLGAKAWALDPAPEFRTAVVGARIAVVPWFWATLASACFRLRQPRPPWTEARAQPGFVACAVTLTVVGLRVGWTFNFAGHYDVWLFRHFLSSLIAVVAPAVIGGWLALWMAGQWTPRADWVDLLGRIVGWGWIILFLIEQVGPVFIL